MEYHIPLPPLRSRPEEILPIAKYSLEKASGLRSGMKRLVRLERDAIKALKQHTWPGNVRELDHVIRAAVVASRVDRNADSLRKEWLRLHTNLDDGGNEYKLALARFNHEWSKRSERIEGTAKQAAKTMGISQDTFRKFRDWSPSEPGKDSGSAS